MGVALGVLSAPTARVSARPIDPERGEAPVLWSQIDPAQMPRMCPGLARVRLALYAAARSMLIAHAPSTRQLRELEMERRSPAYHAAIAAYRAHLSACPVCRGKYVETARQEC